MRRVHTLVYGNHHIFSSLLVLLCSLHHHHQLLQFDAGNWDSKGSFYLSLHLHRIVWKSYPAVYESSFARLAFLFDKTSPPKAKPPPPLGRELCFFAACNLREFHHHFESNFFHLHIQQCAQGDTYYKTICSSTRLLCWNIEAPSWDYLVSACSASVAPLSARDNRHQNSAWARQLSGSPRSTTTKRSCL